MNNRLTIHPKDIGVDVFTIDKGGDYINYTFLEDGMSLYNSISIASQQISKPTHIILNEEIPM